MAPIPETTTTRTTRTTSTSHPGASVPSLDLSDQSYEDDPSPSTPSNDDDDDDVSDDGYSETFGSRGDAPDTPVPRKGDMWSVPEPPQYTSKRVLSESIPYYSNPASFLLKQFHFCSILYPLVI